MAISRAVPSRPMGWRSMKDCSTSRDALARVPRQRGDPLAERGADDRAWADRVAADAVLDEVGGDSLGQPDHGRLAGPVDIAVRDAAHRGCARGDVDDRARPLVEHAGQKSLDGPVHGLDVQVHGEIPVGVGAFEHRAVVHEAGAVEQDVDRTDLPSKRIDGIGRADVQRMEVGAREPFELALVEIGGDDRGALCQKRFSGRSADPLPRRRQEGDLALQPSRHARSSPRSGRLAQIRQGPLLSPFTIEVFGREPCLEGRFDAGHSVSSIENHAVSRLRPFHDHVLAEHALEGEAEPFRGALRGRIEVVALPLVAAVAEVVEDVASEQIHAFRGARGCAAWRART